jgi:uncharacterized membrane protein YdjX (TVP38/TMEM64 family)
LRIPTIAPARTQGRPRHGRRVVLGVLTLLALVAAWRLGGPADLLSVATLRTHRAELTGWVQAQGPLAALAFVATYALAAGLCIPGSVVLTVAGGFLFGAVAGTLLTVLGATAGATAAFLAARAILGQRLPDRLGPRAAGLAEGIRRNAWSYLLVLRLVPLFPFVLVNIVPAVLGVRLRVYVLTTALGIIPATYALSLSGAGLGAVLDADGTPDLRALLTPQLLGALLVLAGLALAGIPLRARFAAPAAGR